MPKLPFRSCLVGGICEEIDDIFNVQHPPDPPPNQDRNGMPGCCKGGRGGGDETRVGYLGADFLLERAEATHGEGSNQEGREERGGGS